jgi:FkbM family methyltransferase
MRVQHLRNYAYLLSRFRNGMALIQSLRRGTQCTEAEEWNGTTFVHPERGGLAGTLVELWIERCYLPDGFYEPRPGDVIVDVGAHVGLFAIWMARRHPDCRVVAVEPSDENHPCLAANVEAAGLGNVTVHQKAISGTYEHGALRPCTDRSIDHRFEASEPGEAGGVSAVPLAGLFELAGTERIAFLKMDVEGAEHAAFASADPSDLERIDRLALEYHDNLVPGTLALLQERLADTHDVHVVPTFDRAYGVLYAVRRDGRG